jgi:hypothetical protein
MSRLADLLTAIPAPRDLPEMHSLAERTAIRCAYLAGDRDQQAAALNAAADLTAAGDDWLALAHITGVAR